MKWSSNPNTSATTAALPSTLGTLNSGGTNTTIKKATANSRTNERPLTLKGEGLNTSVNVNGVILHSETTLSKSKSKIKQFNSEIVDCKSRANQQDQEDPVEQQETDTLAPLASDEKVTPRTPPVTPDSPTSILDDDLVSTYSFATTTSGRSTMSCEHPFVARYTYIPFEYLYSSIIRIKFDYKYILEMVQRLVDVK